MATRINDALGYLGESDERYETGIVGGSLLFVAEYVFVFSGRADLTGFFRGLSRTFGFFDSPALLQVVDLAAVAVGFLSLTIPFGFLLTVVRAVSANEESPPTFLPVSLRSWLRFASRGATALLILGAIVLFMYQLLRTVVSLVFLLTPPVSVRTLWLIPFFDVFSFLLVVFVVFYVPYVMLAVFLLLGLDRNWSRLRSILLGRNRQYRHTWGLLVMLLLFNSDVASFVYALVVQRQLSFPSAGTDSIIAAFLTFYLLVAIVYLFADALSDGRQQ